MPPGARKYLILARRGGRADGRVGVAQVLAGWPSPVCLPRSQRWCHEWLHSVWPSATIRATSPGYVGRLRADEAERRLDPSS